MLFAPLFLTVTLGHIRVPRGYLQELPATYFMESVMQGLADRVDMLETIDIFRVELPAKDVNLVLLRRLRDPTWRTAYLNKLINHDGEVYYAAEESRHIMVVTDGLTVDHMNTLSTWDAVRLKAFSKLVVSGQAEYLKLLETKCPELGMAILETEETIPIARRLSYTQRQILEMALERRVHLLEDLDVDFIRSLTRWSSVASEEKQASFLRFLLTKLPVDVLMHLPTPALRQIFSHSMVLEVMSVLLVDRSILVFLATYVQTSTRFWEELGTASSEGYLLWNWRDILEDIVDDDARMLLKNHFLPALLDTSDADDAVNFLQKHCQAIPGLEVDCVVSRDRLDDADSLVPVVMAYLQTQIDGDDFESSLLAFRFLQPNCALPYAIVKKTIMLQKGDSLPFSMLSATEYPAVMDLELVPHLRQRLVAFAPVEMMDWYRLFQWMHTWLPILIPNLMKHVGLFFDANHDPTLAMSQSRFTPTASLLFQHGHAHVLMNCNSKQLSHWFAIVPSVNPYLTDFLNRHAEVIPISNLFYLSRYYWSNIWNSSDWAYSQAIVRLAELIVSGFDAPQLDHYPKLRITDRIIDGELRRRMDAALSKFI